MASVPKHLSDSDEFQQYPYPSSLTVARGILTFLYRYFGGNLHFRTLAHLKVEQILYKMSSSNVLISSWLIPSVTRSFLCENPSIFPLEFDWKFTIFEMIWFGHFPFKFDLKITIFLLFWVYTCCVTAWWLSMCIDIGCALCLQCRLSITGPGEGALGRRGVSWWTMYHDTDRPLRYHQ